MEFSNQLKEAYRRNKIKTKGIPFVQKIAQLTNQSFDDFRFLNARDCLIYDDFIANREDDDFLKRIKDLDWDTLSIYIDKILEKEKIIMGVFSFCAIEGVYFEGNLVPILRNLKKVLLIEKDLIGFYSDNKNADLIIDIYEDTYSGKDGILYELDISNRFSI